MVNPIVVTTLLLSSTLHCCWLRIFNKQSNYFWRFESAVSHILAGILVQIC